MYQHMIMESANIYQHQHQQLQDQHAHALTSNTTILNNNSLSACSNLKDSWQETNSNNMQLSSLNSPMMVNNNAQDLIFQRDPNQLEADNVLMLRNFSSNAFGYPINGFHHHQANFDHETLSSANSSNSLDMNLEDMDLRNSSRFSDESFGLPYVSHHHTMQPSSLINSLLISNNVSSFSNGGVAADSKRSNIMLETKMPHQTPTKKSRTKSRASCPPFKVRKEKLGDRIAALQQMVSPFGKTDTASVLMEAIGYIKFLQNQVETLSVPYMKSNSKNNNKVVHGPNGNNEEAKRDLRSRGLCLVPLSCLSYVADGGGGVCWPPHDFGGGF